MTLGDGLTLVAGVAASYALTTSLRDLTGIRPPTVQLVLFALQVIQGLTLAVSVVALARVALHRRMPTPAEWWGILVGAQILTRWHFLQFHRWIEVFALVLGDSPSMAGWNWVMAGVFSVGILAGLGLLRLGRRFYPTWLKTILLAGLAVLAMSGPLDVFEQQGGDLFSPSGGFGPGVPSILYREACGWVAALPIGLLFGVPAVAAALERVVGRKWTWVEWASFGGSTMALFVSMMLYPGEFSTPSPAWVAERSLPLAWLVAVAAASRSILVHFGPPWRRWVEGPGDQDRSPPSASDSAASSPWT